MTMRAAARVTMLSAALMCAATPLMAQRLLLPLDDVAYTYIDALQARGVLRELPIIERPYSVGAVRAAVSAARGQLHDAGSLRWLAAIDAAAAKYAPPALGKDSAVFMVSLAGYGVAQTSGTRDLMQSSRQNSVGPGITIRALLDAGPVTGVMRVLTDRRMKFDPEFLGRRDRVLSARTEDAYLASSSRFVRLEVGRVARSWALPGQLGLQVSNGAYSYDHVHLRLGTDGLHLSSIVARLDDERLNFVTDTTAPRYFAAHRLGARVGTVEFGVGESVVYGGKGRGFELSLLNTVAPTFLTQYSESESINVAFSADALWRSRRGTMLGAQVFLDDFQIDRCSTCNEPPGIAVALSADGVPVYGGVRAFAAYTRVNSLTYRTQDRVERYTYRTVGLGQRNSDFDEVKLGLDVGPQLPMPVRVYAAYRRQGAGDYREPYPLPSQYAVWPTIFEGVVVKTVRVAASSAFRVGAATEISVDAGVNRSQNDLRQPGVTKVRAEGRLRVALEPSRLRFRRDLQP